MKRSKIIVKIFYKEKLVLKLSELNQEGIEPALCILFENEIFLSSLALAYSLLINIAACYF